MESHNTFQPCDGDHGGEPCADPQCWLRPITFPAPVVLWAKSEITPDYTLRQISAVNFSRCIRWHTQGINSWSLSDWAVALAGEVGEACDVIKKLNRIRDNLPGNYKAGQLTAEALNGHLAKELADVYLYLDLLAQAAGVDLPSAIRTKFNEVSERNSFPERL